MEVKKDRQTKEIERDSFVILYYEIAKALTDYMFSLFSHCVQYTQTKRTYKLSRQL